MFIITTGYDFCDPTINDYFDYTNHLLHEEEKKITAFIRLSLGSDFPKTLLGKYLSYKTIANMNGEIDIREPDETIMIKIYEGSYKPTLLTLKDYAKFCNTDQTW